jgi:hypothetical protein
MLHVRRLTPTSDGNDRRLVILEALSGVSQVRGNSMGHLEDPDGPLGIDAEILSLVAQ